MIIWNKGVGKQLLCLEHVRNIILMANRFVTAATQEPDYVKLSEYPLSFILFVSYMEK
jgi:hypothetical protein